MTILLSLAGLPAFAENVTTTESTAVPSAVEQPPKKIRYEYLDRSSPHTSRGLERFNRQFKPITVEGEIKERLRTGKTVRLLEFGSGQGVLIMQLRKLFPNIELFGINKRRWRRETADVLRETGKLFHIFNDAELAEVKLPTIYAIDADQGLLPNLSDESFDIIVSQVSIYMVERKDRLIEEFGRILKPGGIALIEVGNFVITDDVGNSRDMANFFTDLNADGYDFRVVRVNKIIMRKTQSKPLNLRLTRSKEKLTPFQIK